MQEIKIIRAETLKEKPTGSKIPFGHFFTDHMFLMDYKEGQGWHNARIVPYGPLEIMPSAMVLHYAIEIFEGMKAYRTADGKIQLFRPLENLRRMNDSADRFCMPHVAEDDFMNAVKTLVQLDQDWVPSEPDTSLYIRPFMFAVDQHVGVHTAHEYIFSIIICPVGSYYAEGINPVRIMIEQKDVRAVRGGTGYTKCGGNYAASIRSGDRAEKMGFTQVLWLDGVERKYVEEVGAMNVMFKINGKIVTPALQGSVLPGITRKSSIDLLRDWGYEVEERPLSIDELIAAAKDGTLEEAWGTGTAAVISPIGEIYYDGVDHVVAGGGIGELTHRLYEELTAIQWGKKPDVRGWIEPVC